MGILRSPVNYNRDKVSEETGLACKGPGRTQQSGKEEADINTIMRRFGITGVMPNSIANPAYIDFDGIFDYRTAVEAVRAAEAAFMAVPAEVRARFQNDPQQYVAFCVDPKNIEELRKLGLAVPAKIKDTPVPANPPA